MSTLQADERGLALRDLLDDVARVCEEAPNTHLQIGVHALTRTQFDTITGAITAFDSGGKRCWSKNSPASASLGDGVGFLQLTYYCVEPPLEPTDEQVTRRGNYFDSADSRDENDRSL